MALDLTDINGITATFGADPNDRTLWGVLADAIEEEGKGALFLAMESGVYRHGVVGLYRRLDAALCAAEKSILEEPDPYHAVEILEVYPDREGETLRFTLAWEGPKKGGRRDILVGEGKVVVTVEKVKATQPTEGEAR